MNQLGDKILKKIREEKITPKPRWQFLLKDYFVWSSFAVSVVVGAISFCLILYVFAGNNWDVYKFLNVSPFQYFIFSLPYLWVLLLALFVALAYYNYKHTKSGYRYETYAILVLSIAASLILGFLFHFGFGAGEKIDTALSNNLPIYTRIHAYCKRENVWSQPEKGLLAGEIKRVADESGNEFELEDFKGFVWFVQKDERTLIPSGLFIIVGRKVRVIGEREMEKIFRAREIRPW